jgi:TRAP-type mannitol/chloroaromatic compound transport system substrate-binding protein
LQVILETASRMINDDMLSEFTARNAQALKTLVEEHGVQVRRLPDDVLAKLKELSGPVVEGSAQQDDLSRRIHASYTRFLADVAAYHAISEQAYINAR